MTPSWEQQCAMLEGEGQAVARIEIRLRSGLTLSGPINVEAARQLFRDPDDPTQLFAGHPHGMRATLMLPPDVVERVAFPAG